LQDITGNMQGKTADRRNVVEIPFEAKLPFLWGEGTFQKNEWSYVNFLVGPNGTGKTLFAEQLIQACPRAGLRTRYLSAERLSGFEKRAYANAIGISGGLERGINLAQIGQFANRAENSGLSAGAFAILKQKLDVRIRIEATLSELFNRRIMLVEEEGFLRPRLQKSGATGVYDFKTQESHGLKELITLLTFLYDDGHSCLIIDEPELHLHPQFQTLFLQEMRRISGDPRSDPSKKVFFLITHSPYFIDVRTVNDLRSCVVFQQDKLPAYVDELEEEDRQRIIGLLPRLNTHHKQFFFASRPVFVEGYLDQQLFTLIQERRDILLGAGGTSIIDVSGNEDLALFFRLCKTFKMEAQIITDLDSIVRGGLRQTVSHDERCKTYLRQEGVGDNWMTLYGLMAREISACVKQIEAQAASADSSDTSLQQFLKALLTSKNDEAKRYRFLVGLKRVREKIRVLVPDCADKIDAIEGRLSKLTKAFERCEVYVLPNGALENHLTSYTGDPYAIADAGKLAAFDEERRFLLREGLSHAQIRSRYEELITVIDKATRLAVIEKDKHLNSVIGDWMHRVQRAYQDGEINSLQSLQTSALVDWASFARIIDLVDFSETDAGFRCLAKLKPIMDEDQRLVEFTSDTNAAKFRLEAAQDGPSVPKRVSTDTP